MTSLAEIAQALREAAVTQIVLCAAFRPGDVIVIECDRPLSVEDDLRVRMRFEQFTHDTHVNVVLLEPGMRLAAREAIVLQPGLATPQDIPTCPSASEPRV
jgi:hypothetical protein